LEKSEIEEKEIAKKKEEVKILKDAEKSIVGEDFSDHEENSHAPDATDLSSSTNRKFTEPNALRLEEIAKLEMNRCAKQLSDATTQLQKITAEYKLLKEELMETLNTDKEVMKKNPQAMKKFQEARSMLNIAETRLKEAAKKTKQAIEELNDSEALLAQAQWRRSQEEELLPLFNKFMLSPQVYTANKQKLILALIFLSKGNFEQKFDLVLKIVCLSNPSSSEGLGEEEVIFSDGEGVLSDGENVGIAGRPKRIKSRPSTAKSHRSNANMEEINYSISPLASSIYNLKFLLFLTKFLYDVLTTISLIPFAKADKDIENYIIRNFTLFSEMNNSIEITTITEYEMKNLIIKYILYINAEEIFHLTSSLYQIPKTMNLIQNFSNYSLLSSSSLSLMKYGIYDFSTTAKDIHYKIINYKNVLENNHKRDIHEAALAMGAIDPFKPDYSKFIIKQENSKSYFIVPHDNKYMTSSEFFHARKTWKYVIKVQASMRAFIYRKISWKVAKYKAYEEAKVTAIKQLKTKILKEFQKREQAKGLGKMKWDAEVRIKQAKLRTSGQNVNRSETVMLLMEEHIQQAKQLIEDKFQQILATENLTHFQENMKKVKTFQKDLLHHHINPLVHFGFNCTVDEHMINPRNYPNLIEELEDLIDPDTGNDLIPSFESKTLDGKTFIHLLRGRKISDYRLKSENILEANLKLHFTSSEVSDLFHFFHRIKFLYEKRLTEFKCMEIISEFPSKRLFLKYLTKNSHVLVKEDLKEQFKFKYDLNTILKYFERLILSDVDFGYLPTFLLNLQKSHEKGLIYIISNYFEKLLVGFNKFVELRLESSNNRFITPKVIVEDEMKNLTAIVSSMEKDYDSHVRKIQEEKTVVQKIYLAMNIAKEKLSMMKNHHCFDGRENKKNKKKKDKLKGGSSKSNKSGKSNKQPQLLTGPEEETYDDEDEIEFLSSLNPREITNLSRELRLNWMLRYKNCLKLIYSQQENAYFGYEELENLLSDFQNIAVRSIKIILDELYLPDNEKTIPVAFSRDINGRKISQRGIQGKKLYYQAYNIFFYIYLDYDGAFNGSDEFAAKLSNKERLGSQFINDSFITNLMAPLLLTVDYFGFRIVASAKLPIYNIIFNEDSTIKRISTEMVHGLTGLGDTFINKNRVGYNLFKTVANKLNLKEHGVKGKLDFAVASTFGASLKFYRFFNPVTKEEEFYLRNCWNLFPHEVSAASSTSSSPSSFNLPTTPQDQNIFWRFLRPEYLLERVGEPLSTDSGTILTMNTPEEDKNFEVLQSSISTIFESLVPQLLKKLVTKIQLPLKESDFEYLITEIHKLGICVRHLGYMKSLLWRKLYTKCSVYHYENCIHLVDDLSDEIHYGDYIKINSEIYIVQQNDKYEEKTATIIPLNQFYNGQSMHEVSDISISKILLNETEVPLIEKDTPKGLAAASSKAIYYSTEPLRVLILLEMILRTMKNLIRYQMRLYLEKNQLTSESFVKSLIINHLNILTGNSNFSESYFHEILFMNIRERFGKHCIHYSERKEVIPMLQGNIPMLVTRLSRMLGIQLTLSSIISLKAHPIGYHFIIQDCEDYQPKVKNNITIFPFVEAMNIARKGQDISKQSYRNLILHAKPLLFYTLSERKGSKYAFNYGLLGSDYSGSINDGCLLEQSGPFHNEKFLRSFFFHPSSLAFLDVKYHPSLIPQECSQHFSIQFYYNCVGGNHSYRTIVKCGRYHIGVNRDNRLFLSFSQENHVIYLDLYTIRFNVWEHCCFTFDGTTLRFYLNSLIIKELEIDEYFYQKEREFQTNFDEKKNHLNVERDKEIVEMKTITQEECTKFFVTKEGMAYLKKEAQHILDTEEFKDLPVNTGANNLETGDQRRFAIMKERKIYATKKAKDAHVQATYQTNCLKVTEKFDYLMTELEETHKKQMKEGKENSLIPLRIGASHQDANSRYGDAYFYGNLSCLSIYDYCLPADVVRSHYHSSIKHVKTDVIRIYHQAIISFHAAITTFTWPVDYYLPFVNTYIDCLLYLLDCETQERNPLKTISIIEEICYLIELYTFKSLLEPVATLLNKIPRDAEFADLIVKVILSIKKTDKLFLSKTNFINRQLLINLPFEFGLIVSNRPKEYYEAAAFIFQEVCRDMNYSFVYGDIDLKWITELSHYKLIISIVQTAYESKSLKVLELTKFYDYTPTVLTTTPAAAAKAVNKDTSSPQRALQTLTRSTGAASTAMTEEKTASSPSALSRLLKKTVSPEEEEYFARIPPSKNLLFQEKDNPIANIDLDVQVLSYHLPKLEGIDLSYFISLTDFAMEFFKRFANLKVLILDECYELSDHGLKVLHSPIFTTLEKLSLERLLKISDTSLMGISSYLTNLLSLNLNYCYQVTLIPVIELLKANQFLHTLGLAHCMVFDEDLITAAAVLRDRPLTNLDLSYCSYMTDLGFQSITETCKLLKKINLKGNQRLTSSSIQMLVNRCWYLENVNLEDIYLLTDSAFQYNASYDGRAQTMEKMLTNVVELNLNHCDHLRDQSLSYLGERCRKIQTLTMSNCYRMTDQGLRYLMDPLLCADSNVPLCASLVSLNLGYMNHPNSISGNQLIDFLKECLHLEKLDLSGLSNIINDKLIHQLCCYLSSLQTLKLNHCIQITNLSMCSIAENLWLEELQISGCSKITNEGIDVIAETCLGLKIMHLLKLKYISMSSLHFLKKNCPILQELLYDPEIEAAALNNNNGNENNNEAIDKEKDDIYSDIIPSMLVDENGNNIKRRSNLTTPMTTTSTEGKGRDITSRDSRRDSKRSSNNSDSLDGEGGRTINALNQERKYSRNVNSKFASTTIKE
jgi:hypothetical protein